MKRKTIVQYICLGICIVISVVFIFALNYVVGYYNDDLWYSTNLVTGENLKTIGDVITSQIWHYANWGGRSMAHGLLQLSFICGPYAINYINTAVTILLSVLLVAISGKIKNRDSIWLVILAFSMFVSMNANLKETLLWQSGVANYLYMGLFQMLYLWFFLRELREDGKGKNSFISLLSLLVAPIAGWSNENMGPAVFLGSVAVIIFYIKENKKVKWWMIVSSVECLIGCAFMILAPGNAIRSAQAEEALYDSRLHRQIIYRLYWVSRGMFDYLLPILIVVLLLAITYYGILKQKPNREDMILFTVGMLATGAMLLSPHFPDRATFGIMIVFISLSISLLRKIVAFRPDITVYLKAVTVFFWLAAMYCFSERYLYEIGVLRF